MILLTIEVGQIEQGGHVAWNKKRELSFCSVSPSVVEQVVTRIQMKSLEQQLLYIGLVLSDRGEIVESDNILWPQADTFLQTGQRIYLHVSANYWKTYLVFVGLGKYLSILSPTNILPCNNTPH